MDDHIRSRDELRQVVNFAGLEYGNITPTDIDGVLEFQDKVVVFMEAKYGGREPPLGQKLALERLCNNCLTAGKRSIVLVARHDTLGEIMLSVCEVFLVYVNGQWRPPFRCLTVREAIDSFLASAHGRG